MSLTFQRSSGLMHEADMFGLTLKENCGDPGSSEVIDIIRELQSYGVDVHVTDPQAEPEEAGHEYGVKLTPLDALPRKDAIVAAVAHREYHALSVTDLGAKMVPGGAFIDLKAAFSEPALSGAGYRVRRL